MDTQAPKNPTSHYYAERPRTFVYEIRRDDERGGFELHLVHSSGRRIIKHFQDSSDLARGARKVQNELRGSGWRTHHS